MEAQQPDPERSPGAVTPGEIDLLDIVVVLWRGWARILVAGLSGGIIAALIALSMPDIYRAEIVLAPVEENDSARGLLAQAGGLASLAGLSLGLDQPVDTTALALEVLQSRQFFTEFARKREVLVPLLATDRWDPDTGELLVDPDVYDVAAQRWLLEETRRSGPEPSMLKAHEAFQNLLEIERASDSGVVTIALEHRSPLVAHEWLGWLVEDLNERMRRKEIQQAERSIAYLREQVEQTQVADLRAIFFQLIQSQTETMMLARVREEYVLETIDPSFVPERKSRPRRALICVAGGVLGGFVGIAWVLIAHAVRSKRE